MSVEIRRIRVGDAGGLADFYNGLSEASKRTFRPLGITTTAEVCRKIIRENGAEVGSKFDLVAIEAVRIVGWSFLWNLKTDKPSFGLGVADDYQGQGIGSALMDRVMQFAVARKFPKVTLTVVQDNDQARMMYERRGFVRQEAFIGEDGLPYFYMTADWPFAEKYAPQEDAGKPDADELDQGS